MSRDFNRRLARVEARLRQTTAHRATAPGGGGWRDPAFLLAVLQVLAEADDPGAGEWSELASTPAGREQALHELKELASYD